MKNILDNFDIYSDISIYGDGHINRTYKCPSFILQKINTGIFENPEKLMENIDKVTSHIRKKAEMLNKNPERSTLSIVKTIDGKLFYRDECGGCWRVYKFIEGAVTYSKCENPLQMYNAAKAFGQFQNMLSDFPAESLFETIKDFHDTGKRYEQFETAVSENKAGRLGLVADEIEFVRQRKNIVNVITDGIKNKTIPVRVTHNDTKLNNVMLDEKTGEGICVIDLDTVMPGSFLYDFGDSLRFGASTADEDEQDLNKVWFDLDIFRSFTKGYLEEAKDALCEDEIRLLPFSVKLMTLECGMRFLADYLNGDTYFATHREGQNLDRARTQFKLVWDIEQKEDEMKKIVEELICD